VVPPEGAGARDAGEAPPPLAVGGALCKMLREILKLADSDECCIFFDPEETECFVYHLTSSGAEELMKFPVELWAKELPVVKSMNCRTVSLDGREFGALVIVSFTNLGERAAIRLLAGLPGPDHIREEKKSVIRRINTFKPPTALTHNNIDHLLQLVESRAGMTEGDLFEMLREERVFSEDEIAELRSSGSIKFVLAKPVPRKQLVECLARWMGVEYVDVEMTELDDALAKKIPEGTARSLNMLPYAEEDGRIRVAFWNPFDENAIFTVSEYLGGSITPVMSCEEDIRYELEKIYTV